MPFKSGTIDGVIWRPLKKYHDARGWLCELFRDDDLPAEFNPVMAYISVTQPGVSRGPHEHVDQADVFCFIGPGSFKMYLWDNRPKSAVNCRIKSEAPTRLRARSKWSSSAARMPQSCNT